MMQIKIAVVCVCILATTVLDGVSNNCINSATPTFLYRSLSFYLSREMVGLAPDYHVYQFDTERTYATIALAAEYSHSFASNAFSACLFGDGINKVDGNYFLGFSGTLSEQRATRDWLADYFFVSPNFSSTVQFDPTIENALANATLYIGFDCLLRGLYLWAHAPLVYTRWTLNPCETITHKGTEPFWAGYFTPEEVLAESLNTSVLPALFGQALPDLGTVTAQPLMTSRWYRGTKPKIGLADLRVAVGWNMFQDEDFHIGLSVRTAAPTGSNPDGCFFFEPVVGNSHHWELGAGLSSHIVLWRSCDFTQYVGLHLESAFMHLFPAKEIRNFDLCNAPNSRYTLAIALSKPVDNDLGSQDDGLFVDANRQFKNLITYTANLTAAPVDVSIAIQADICLMLNYTKQQLSIDLGYELWATSCERIQFDPECQSTLARGPLWALKGDAQLFGYNVNVNPIAPVALNVSENESTIFAGQNRSCGQPASITVLQSNQGVDSASLAFSAIDELLTQPVVGAPQINLSQPAQLLNAQSIDIFGARAQGQSNTLFAHISYTFDHCYFPFIGIGFRSEWGVSRINEKCNLSNECLTNKSNCSRVDCTSIFDKCHTCSRCTISQAFVTIKGGITF